MSKNQTLQLEPIITEDKKNKNKKIITDHEIQEISKDITGEEPKKRKKITRTWNLIKLDEFGNYELITELNLIPISLTNMFNVVQDLILDISKTVPEFSDWFSNLITNYINDGNNSEIILNSSDDFINMTIKYIDAKHIKYDEFFKSEKATKTSIEFRQNDIRSIMISSTCLKLYSIICYNKNLKLPSNSHKLFYEKLMQPCIDTDSTTKIFKLVRSRIYRSSITDRYMWEMIRIMISETPESYIMIMFNFLMEKMISTLSIETNPIHYLVKTIDDGIRWMMRTMYKDRILYGEAFSGSDDIYGSSLSKDSFFVYCCNDVIGKSAKVAMELLENEYNLTDADFTRMKDRLEQVDSLTPLVKLLTLPIISKILEIPYKYLLTAPPKHILLIGVFIYYISDGIMKDKFPVITDFLAACPVEMRYKLVKSSYKLRNIEFILNDIKNVKRTIFGFENKTFQYNTLSTIVGIINTSRRDLISIITDKPMRKLTYYDLESDLINFFLDFYSGNLDSMFDKMREKLDSYL